MAGKTDKWFGTLTAANFNSYAKLERTINQPNGEVCRIIRYVPDLSPSAAEATKDNLVAALEQASPKIDGVAFDTNTWQRSFVYIEEQPDGGRTVKDWLTLPTLRNPVGDGDPDVVSNLLVERNAAVGRFEEEQTQAYLRVSNTDAVELMGSSDTTFTPGGLPFCRSRRTKNEDGTNNVYVTGRTITITYAGWGGDNDFETQDIWVQRVPDETATMGFKWRKVTRTLDYNYTSSDTTAKSHIAGGDEGSQILLTKEGNFLAIKVTHDPAETWTYTDWPS